MLEKPQDVAHAVSMLQRYLRCDSPAQCALLQRTVRIDLHHSSHARGQISWRAHSSFRRITSQWCSLQVEWAAASGPYWCGHGYSPAIQWCAMLHDRNASTLLIRSSCGGRAYTRRSRWAVSSMNVNLWLSTACSGPVTAPLSLQAARRALMTAGGMSGVRRRTWSSMRCRKLPYRLTLLQVAML